MRYFLEDDRIGLRGLVEEDCIGGYADWFNDSEICKYNNHHRYPMSKAELLDYVNQRNPTEIVLAVEEKIDKIHIGNISLQHIDFINRQAEIAFVFGEKNFWCRGLATAAAKLLINHAFMELGIHRIYFGTLDENIGMQRIGEKLHFTKIGIRRQALFKDGMFHDIYDYDLIDNEWKSAIQK